MTVKELRDMLPKNQDDKNVVFVSGSGIEWNFNKKIVENPKSTKTNDSKSEQLVIFIK